MKLQLPSIPSAGALALVFLLSAGHRLSAADLTNQLDLRTLAQRHIPECTLRLDATGKVDSLVSKTGEVLKVATAAQDHPYPTNGVAGYWFTPTMDFLSRQKPRITTTNDARELVQLMHLIWAGPAFVRQKFYNARPIRDGWVVQIDHDFVHYPGMIMGIEPYELLIDEAGRTMAFRQRSYFYLGSGSVYSNTVQSVYDREIKRNRGHDYPEILFKELRNAWENETNHPSTKPDKP